MDTQYKHMHFVSFQSLVNWSVAHLLNRDLGFTKHYSFVKIGDLIHRSSELVIIEDDILYTQVTLKTNGGGAVLRDKKLGKDIGTKKQYLAKEGQFIMSKIDARNGAFGVVSKELDNAIVTGDFPLFDVDKERINPVYLYLLSSTRPFVRYAQSCSRGTTNRQRIDIDAFLGLQIPLPSLKEQNEIVIAYNNSLALADEYEQKAIKEEEKGKQYISTQLGFTTINSDSSTPALLMYFKKLSELSVRWDVWNIAQSCYNGEYELISLSKVIRMSSGQFLPTKAQIDGPYNVYGGNGKTGTHNKYCYSGKRIVIGRVGEYCGNVHLVDGDYWITDNALKVDKIYEGITWEFLAVALEALNINQYKSISAQPSISQSKILQLQIPLPPLELQNEIVEHITLLREKQKAMIEQAKERRLQATQQFEQTIFE